MEGGNQTHWDYFKIRTWLLMSIKNWATCWSNFRPPKHEKLVSVFLLSKCLLKPVAVPVNVQYMCIVGEPVQ